MDEEVLTLKDLVQIIKSKLIMILIITVLCTSFGFYYQYNFIKPTYLTTTKLFIGKEINGDKGSVYDNSDVSLYQNLMQTYAGIISSEDLIERAVEEMHISISVNQVAKSLSVEAGEKDQFLTVSLYTSNAEEGAAILNAIIKEFIDTTKDLISNCVVSIISTPKVATEPYNNMNSHKIIAISVLGGLFIGISLAIFLEFLDNTVKRKEDIYSVLGVPILGVVPKYYDKGKVKKSKKDRGSVNIYDFKNC